MWKRIKAFLFSNSVVDIDEDVALNKREEVIKIVEAVLSKVTDDSDMVWAGYDSAAELRDELSMLIHKIRLGDMASLDVLNVHFAPTSTFQEHSISNGWGNEYITISTKFDRLYNKLKNNLWE